MGPYPQETADLVTFNEEILNRKLHFLRSALFTKPLFLKLFKMLKMSLQEIKLWL